MVPAHRRETMRTIRRGTHRKIAASLKRHHELMQKYQDEGMSKDEASKKAFLDVTESHKKKPNDSP